MAKEDKYYLTYLDIGCIVEFSNGDESKVVHLTKTLKGKLGSSVKSYTLKFDKEVFPGCSEIEYRGTSIPVDKKLEGWDIVEIKKTAHV